MRSSLALESKELALALDSSTKKLLLKYLCAIISLMKRLFIGLKHWFIPHPGNDNKPHFLRDATVGVLIALAILAEGVLILDRNVLTPNSTLLGQILSAVLVDE